MNKSTVREFLKGTRNNAQITISYGDYDVFEGTYSEFKKAGKEFFDCVVLSWDAVDCVDDAGKEFLCVGISI